MLELELRGAGAGAGTEAGAYAGVGAGADTGLELERQRERELGPVLARSRRPAILTYRSAVVEMAHRVARLPWYVVGWRQEAETVEVGLMEGVEFQKGWRNLPASLRLEVASASVLQVYGVKVVFTARFAGLRYVDSPARSPLVLAWCMGGGINGSWMLWALQLAWKVANSRFVKV